MARAVWAAGLSARMAEALGLEARRLGRYMRQLGEFQPTFELVELASTREVLFTQTVDGYTL